MSRRTKFFLAVLFQAGIAAWLAGSQEQLLANGTQVVLRSTGVDPYALFLGRYIRTRPEGLTFITRADVPCPEEEFADGSRLWVLVEPDAEPTQMEYGSVLHWRVVGVAAERPKDGVAIRGRVESDNGARIRARFGLNRFYIPETAVDPTHWRPEVPEGEEAPPRTLSVLMRVAGSGRAAIEDLLVEGEPYADWNRRVTEE